MAIGRLGPEYHTPPLEGKPPMPVRGRAARPMWVVCRIARPRTGLLSRTPEARIPPRRTQPGAHRPARSMEERDETISADLESALPVPPLHATAGGRRRDARARGSHGARARALGSLHDLPTQPRQSLPARLLRTVHVSDPLRRECSGNVR